MPVGLEDFLAAVRLQVEVPEGASPHMQAMIAALNSKPKRYKERAATQALEEPLARLKSAPSQERLAFVFEALAQMASHQNIAWSIAMKGAAAEVLRQGVTLNSLDALRLIEAASIREFRFSFPYKAILSALKDAR